MMLKSEVPSHAGGSFSRLLHFAPLQKFCLLATRISTSVLKPDFISSCNLFVFHFINFFLYFQIKALSQKSMSEHDHILMLL